MAHIRRFLSFFLFMIFVSGSISAFSASLERESRELSKGEALFNANCSKCHGVRGMGTDKGPPFIHNIYHPNHHSDLSFHWAVERGVAAHHWMFGDMPPVKGLSPEDTGLIIKYVRKLQKEAGIF